MPDPFIAKLKHGAELTAADERVLCDGIERVDEFEANRDLVRSGERPGAVRLILGGLACRYKSVSKGKSQILAFLVPGDLCDFHVAVLGAMDHSIKALTDCKVARVSTAAIDVWTNHPRINRALWWATLVDEAIMRQWIVNLGARPADERIAHLFVELLHRLKTVGLATDKGYSLPVTQDQLAECAGLSAMHVSRVLARLRDQGLVTFQRHRVAIEDLGRLTTMAGFDPDYLHLEDQRTRIHDRIL